MIYSDSFGKNSSKILLGTAYFGDYISKEEAFRMMDTFVEMGGNHIDTARLYADGEAEKVIGEWLKNKKNDNIFLSTKGGFPRYETPDVSRLSESEIRSDLEESLTALGLECIEFYWLHRDDEAIPVETIIDMMNTFVKEGKIKKFGASNWRYSRIEEANNYAASKGVLGFSASQIRFSPAIIAPSGNADRTLVDMDTDSFAYYGKQKLPVAAYASQAKGFFSKMVSVGEEGLSVKSRERYLCDENIKRFEIIKNLAGEYDCSIASAVCAALTSLKQPDVFPIIGGRNVEQIVDSLHGADITISDEELKILFGF